MCAKHCHSIKNEENAARSIITSLWWEPLFVVLLCAFKMVGKRSAFSFITFMYTLPAHTYSILYSRRYLSNVALCLWAHILLKLHRNIFLLLPLSFFSQLFSWSFSTSAIAASFIRTQAMKAGRQQSSQVFFQFTHHAARGSETDTRRTGPARLYAYTYFCILLPLYMILYCCTRLKRGWIQLFLSLRHTRTRTGDQQSGRRRAALEKGQAKPRPGDSWERARSPRSRYRELGKNEWCRWYA